MDNTPRIEGTRAARLSPYRTQVRNEAARLPMRSSSYCIVRGGVVFSPRQCFLVLAWRRAGLIGPDPDRHRRTRTPDRRRSATCDWPPILFIMRNCFWCHLLYRKTILHQKHWHIKKEIHVPRGVCFGKTATLLRAGPDFISKRSVVLYYNQQGTRTNQLLSPRIRRASCKSLTMMVTRPAWIASRFVSSNSPTR
jgi:hypothetical protein